MSSDSAPTSPRAIRLLCFLTAIIVGGEISIYHSLADLIGRALLGREEGLGPAALAVQLLRILPGGIMFLALAIPSIILVGQSRPRLLWFLMIGIVLVNVGLLIASVAKDYDELDNARRRGRAGTGEAVWGQVYVIHYGSSGATRRPIRARGDSGV